MREEEEEEKRTKINLETSFADVTIDWTHLLTWASYACPFSNLLDGNKKWTLTVSVYVTVSTHTHTHTHTDKTNKRDEGVGNKE